jgi:hypothetical protein
MKKLTYEYVKDYIESRGCKLISDKYEDSDSKLEILFACGHLGMRTFNKLKANKSVCAKCAGNKKYTLEEIIKKLSEYGFILDDNQKYINANTKIDFHDKEGYGYSFSIHCLDGAYKGGFNVGRTFEKRNKYALDNMRLWLKKNNKSFSLNCEEYKGAHYSNIVFKCEKCDSEWVTAWSNIYSCGTECPNCQSSSHGEKFVNDFLNKNDIIFETQKKFPDCKNKRCLPFDFYLPDYNLCCEVQGIQHFFSRKHFGGEEQLILQQKHDQIKRDYCKNNNIKLIEISYLDFKNIEQILTKELSLERKEVEFIGT